MLMVSHHRLFRIYGYGFPDAVWVSPVKSLSEPIKTLESQINYVEYVDTRIMISYIFQKQK